MKQTTIQIHPESKKELESLREHKRETYEDIIMKLVSKVKSQETEVVTALISGYKEMAEDSLNIAKEWSITEKELD